ncbi:MAG: hypothetical protein PHQ54_02870 [Candidatus Omnitrophica bacterium]|nr:hypothetical protein [Candidatus Omnitrophota bacterium]
MLSKKDYRSYLGQMLAQEQLASEIYLKSLALTDNGPVKEKLEKIYLEELEHIKIVKLLMDMLSPD